jgi:hypothetical protein
MSIERADLDDVFGASVIDKWADLENEGDLDHIAARVNWAINLAEAHVQAKIKMTTYVWDTVKLNPMVEHAIALKAGMLLHTNRASTDSDGEQKQGNPMARFEKLYKDFFKAVSANEISLGDTEETVCIANPYVYKAKPPIPTRGYLGW